jgi:hypothetical protein
MKYATRLICFALLITVGCKKKDDIAPATIPTLTTAAVTNLNGSTGQSGGVITDNGGTAISVSGICWSKTNNIPTTSDDTTKGTTSSGSFTAQLKNLTPSTTYYVRAYAINNVGIGYGNVVTFNTSNAAPQAKSISFVGAVAITSKVKVTYMYSDYENDAQATAGYQWYLATDTTGGAAGTAISGATDSFYMIAAGDQNKFLRAVITPKAAAGTNTGVATNSYWIGPVGPEPTSVTFSYNGQSVTYGILTSSVTGKKWLDRNIGATRVATAFDDYLAYGDLFQWGRPADGHQLMTWTSATAGTPVNGKTATLATSDIPSHNLFISTSGVPNDWRADHNTNRWNKDAQGPCPYGWHVPTKNEWEGEILKNNLMAFSLLKLPSCGFRGSNGDLLVPGNFGLYWGSNILFVTSPTSYVLTSNASSQNVDNISSGMSVRCIKD